MKKPISATIDQELIDWINSMLIDTRFRNRSHIIETAIEMLKEKVDKEAEEKKKKQTPNKRR